MPMEESTPLTAEDSALDPKPETAKAPDLAFSRAGSATPAAKNRIPYEKDGTVRFMSTDRILAIESDGHYTKIRTDYDALFCPWSLSKVENSPPAQKFLKTHRRFLVNPAHIMG